MASPFAVPLAVLLAGACASARPPAGPKHTPSGTAEAATECPKERKRAQEAREALLGTDDEALRAEAAARVFAHGQCESQAMGTLVAPSGNHDAILGGLRIMRGGIRDASSLFLEVRQYGQSRWTMQALVQVGALKLRFAETVSAIAPPAEMDAQARASFSEELGEAAQALRGEARTALQEALSGAEQGGQATEEACKLLQSMSVQHARC